MTDGPTNEEREELIAGDRAGSLAPDEAAELALLADLLADPSTWAEPDPGLEDAVVRAVASADASPSTANARPATATAAPRRRRLLMSAIAAAATIAIIFGVLVATRSSSSTDYRAQLSATGVAPGARASADIARNNAGFRVTLDAHGLPKLPAGEYYQAWLKNAAGVLVPIGTFSSSDGQVTLWSGVSPTDFPTITVTIEAADNNQASSGRRVLVGQVHAG
jgi:hypothetical protein